MVPPEIIINLMVKFMPSLFVYDSPPLIIVFLKTVVTLFDTKEMINTKLYGIFCSLDT
jgi:hypothetical protein